MGFMEDLRPWIDADGLVGNQPNPKPWSSGNQLLETAFAVLYADKLVPNADHMEPLVTAMWRCQLPSGSFQKNPGRPDEITHDDLIAAAAMKRIAGGTAAESMANRLAALGERTGWDLGNTGEFYQDAQARPWHVAYYKLAATRTPAWYELASMVVETLWGALSLARGKTDPGGDRLRWLRLEAVAEASPWLQVSAFVWRLAARRAYVSPGTMMEWYYNTPSHPYARWGHNLLF
jgi:hypothetical protein